MLHHILLPHSCTTDQTQPTAQNTPTEFQTHKKQEIQQLAAAANGNGKGGSGMMIPPETMEAAAIAVEQAAKVIGFDGIGGIVVVNG